MPPTTGHRIRASLGQRWTGLLGMRLALALGALATVVFLDVHEGAEVVEASVVGYVLATGAMEAVRRRWPRTARWVLYGSYAVDAVFLERVVDVTGGNVSPLAFLIYLHIVAVSLLVSYRSGLTAAIWHAVMVFASAGMLGALYLDGFLVAAPLGAGVRATSYLVAALAVAAIASIDERALQRSRQRLTALLDLTTRLERVDDVTETLGVLADHTVDHLGFRRAVALTFDSASWGPATVIHDETLGSVLVDDGVPADEGVIGRAADRAPVLSRVLEPGADDGLRQLLPGAENVVVVPLVVDGEALGALAAEWRPGPRSRLPETVLAGVEAAARHGGLALRSALLLAEVNEQSRRDPLTGLANRLGFDEALAQELSRARRDARPCSLVLVDLDHFKAVNDSRGHAAGDEVLVRVAGALREAGRAHDTPARIGGDEFALVLADCDHDGAVEVAHRAIESVADSVGPTGVTASAGLATADEPGRGADELLRAADAALYRAKASGRARVCAGGADVIDLVDGVSDRFAGPGLGTRPAG